MTMGTGTCLTPVQHWCDSFPLCASVDQTPDEVVSFNPGDEGRRPVCEFWHVSVC